MRYHGGVVGAPMGPRLAYLPRIFLIPASISFKAASRVSSPAVSRAVVSRMCSPMSGYSLSRERPLATSRLASSASTYGSADLVEGSFNTEKRGLWMADRALGNLVENRP